MPIDIRRKILFVHIPKTAGGSIEKALGLYGSNNNGSNFIDKSIAYGYRQVIYSNRREYRAQTSAGSWYSHFRALRSISLGLKDKSIPLQHASYNDLLNNYDLSNYFIFSFVRNPYQRLLSAYRWLKVKKDINTFIHDDLNSLAKTNYYFYPQHTFLVNKSDKILIDFIGKFESLHQDLERLENKLGIELDVNNIHASNPSRQIKLNDLSQKRIQEIYKNDFELFNYSKDYQSNFGLSK